MEIKKESDDRRVQYTKKVLKESFIDLLEHNDISKISVKGICEDANINRTTFYNHYSDQYDLMRQLENELIENIGIYLKKYTLDETNISLLEIVEKIFEYIKENAKLCKMLLSDKGNLKFQKKIMMIVYDQNIPNLNYNSSFSQEELDYLYAYTITGSIGVIQKWLDNNMEKSTHSMAKLIITLTKNN